MNVIVDVHVILEIFISALVTFIGIGIRSIFTQLRELNGSVRETKIWQQQHERQDDERHHEVREALSALRR